MQKSRLGISVGLFGAAIYFASFFGGYLVAFVLTGYVLLFEENDWLRKNSVKAVALMVSFSLLNALIYLLPNVVSFFNYFLAIFHGSLGTYFLSRIIDMLSSAVGLIQKVLFIVLGLKALNQGTISIPTIDKLIDKHM